LLERFLKSPKFAIKFDQSTDISNLQLLTYLRYCFENRVQKDLLFCQPLEGRPTGEDIFVKLNGFFIANELSWNDCVGVCTDGAAAMTGKKKGLLAHIKNLNNATDVISMHCIIHREALTTKQIAPELNKVLQTAVTVVNFIAAKFSALFETLQSRGIRPLYTPPSCGGWMPIEMKSVAKISGTKRGEIIFDGREPNSS
jgi:hypothetical protein